MASLFPVFSKKKHYTGCCAELWDMIVRPKIWKKFVITHPLTWCNLQASNVFQNKFQKMDHESQNRTFSSSVEVGEKIHYSPIMTKNAQNILWEENADWQKLFSAPFRNIYKKVTFLSISTPNISSTILEGIEPFLLPKSGPYIMKHLV